jgi:site-specific recombinase XerD
MTNTITLNHTIRTDKQRKDGTYTIYLRLTANRKSKYIGTDITVQSKHWNKKKGQVRGSHNLSLQLNRRLENQLIEAKQIKLELAKEERLSADNLYQAIRGEDSYKLLEEADEYHEQLKKDNRYSESKRFGVIRNQFSEFISRDDLNLESFDEDFADRFTKFLLTEIGNNNNTVRRKLTTLRAFARSLKLQEKIDINPFEKVKPPKKIHSEKPKLSLDQIESIKSLDLELKSDLWHVRNYFLYSFYNAGIRFGDLATLKWSNIQDEKLRYQMRKTKKFKSIDQYEEPLQILKSYGYPTVDKNEYIFPILKEDYEDLFDLKQKISSANASVNSLLKDLAEEAEIDTKISTHVARHSFAQHALREGMSIYSISKLLGHTKIKTTARYLQSFDHELVQSEMEKLF